jgi:hypothetical protein
MPRLPAAFQAVSGLFDAVYNVPHLFPSKSIQFSVVSRQQRAFSKVVDTRRCFLVANPANPPVIWEECIAQVMIFSIAASQ